MLRIAVAPQLPSVNHLSINRSTDIIGFDRYYSVQAEPESLVQITIAYYNLNTPIVRDGGDCGELKNRDGGAFQQMNVISLRIKLAQDVIEGDCSNFTFNRPVEDDGDVRSLPSPTYSSWNPHIPRIPKGHSAESMRNPHGSKGIFSQAKLTGFHKVSLWIPGK